MATRNRVYIFTGKKRKCVQDAVFKRFPAEVPALLRELSVVERLLMLMVGCSIAR